MDRSGGATTWSIATTPSDQLPSRWQRRSVGLARSCARSPCSTAIQSVIQSVVQWTLSRGLNRKARSVRWELTHEGVFIRRLRVETGGPGRTNI
eukprot:2027994-Pyramimonas_sp.AAC.1